MTEIRFSPLSPFFSPSQPLPYMQARISAGFPSPAADCLEDMLDLNAYLVARPAATFIVRITGDSMTGAGIHDGDLAIVDRSLSPLDDDIVVAALDGEMTLKRLRRGRDAVFLVPANPKYPPIRVDPENDLVIWGVVTSVIHHTRRRG